MKSEALIQFPQCHLTRTGLTIDKSVTETDWKKIGQTLRTIEGSIQFWIGDWLRFGEGKGYIERGKYEQAEEITGMERKTLRNAAYVSGAIESSLRKDDLSFSHHMAVAPLEPKEQAKWLNKASAEETTYRDLRDEIRQEKKSFESKPMPKGTYDLIYCDPPWQYDFAETDNRKIENQYPTMSVDEICALSLPAIADDALLLMWGTAPKIQEALKVIEAWGFDYKTHGIWDKEKIGMGYWFRGQHELLLVATRGDFPPPAPEYRNSSVYREERGEHSAKPTFFYDWVEKAFGKRNRIELFSRTKRKGWDSWGNE